MTTYDTAARLRTLATEALKAAGGDVKRAAVRLGRALAKNRDIRVAIAVDYLTRLGEPPIEVLAPPIEVLPPGNVAPKRHEIHSRRLKGAHRRPQRGTGMPTVAQKAGEVAAAVRREAIVFERKVRGGERLGQIRVHELRALVQECGHAAGSFVARGYEDAVDAILFGKLADHCIATDPDARVVDIVNGTTATKYLNDAKREAAHFIQNAAARIAAELSGPQQVSGAA